MTEPNASIAKTFSKPIEKLIDAVCAATGTLYEPTRITRRATAEAKALIIATSAQIEANDLLDRAGARFLAQETRRQSNVDAIVEAAIAELPESVNEKPIDVDWLAAFFDDCKDISNEILRKLWARLLAEEVAEPGQCSRRTMAILKTLSPGEAALFGRAANFAWSMAGAPEKYFPKYVALENGRLVFSDLLVLHNIGLLSSVEAVSLSVTDVGILEIGSVSWPFHLQGAGEASIPVHPLTQAGAELAGAIPVSPPDDFVKESLGFFTSWGLYPAAPNP